MTSVLISIKPKWCELIASGKKTIEVRKTQPRLNTPFKVYIYCTQGKPTLGRYLENNSLKATPETDFDHYNRNTLFRANGKVIGEFVCDEITGGFWIAPFSDYLQRQSCLSYDEVCDYANGKPIFAWHISNLVIYDQPRELSDFTTRTSVYYDSIICDSCTDFGFDCKKCRYSCDYQQVIKAPKNMMKVCEWDIEDKVLISIKPEQLCKILNGEKTIECRKRILKEMMSK